MHVKSSRELYGWDKFSKVTLIVGIFLFVTRYAWFLGTALIIYSIWRSRSTNVNRRNNEKFVYENIERRFYYKFNSFRQIFKKKIGLINIKIRQYKPIEKFKENRKYIITNCPKCKQKLRLPRKKGKIIVTCSNCNSEFRLKT
ncbi:hypothetical protein LGK95_09740 [Clostridium algoriphilum]|uniref:hypothetical protein n=1 Tax=Clostridium algoriphilum TaxID=198347 RepID=UPI001CF2FDD5|nr:hypothetical protein [Clostridium algoriphilum]MCB2293801.1 hypothetical protein [Clostridium algoriphilum]